MSKGEKMSALLSIKDLHASINNREILRGINLSIGKAEIHALMGPNGSGKSTLANVLMANPLYSVSGSIFFNGKKINKLNATQRAKLGFFLAFQMPTEIDGLSFSSFIREAFNSLGYKMPLADFNSLLENDAKKLKLNTAFLKSDLNKGLSGGEKKKLELLQLLSLKPKLAIIDEIDSGLDIDSLKNVALNLKEFQKKTKASLLLITHYKRILDFIKPDFVHILIDGKIVLSSNASLLKKLEEKGYAWITKK